jgi:CRP-like cAMP-binding protein
MIHSIQPLLEAHDFFAGFPQDFIEYLVSCAKNVAFEQSDWLMREGQPATHFYLIRRGSVRLQIHGAQRGPLTIQTASPGDLIGWSWLIPPHVTRFSAQALERVVVLEFDGVCVRKKCDDNPAVGYKVVQRVASVLAQRLSAARLQLLDIYGSEVEV